MNLAYREFGQGQPFIILHGLFGQSDNWNTLAKQFAEQNFHVFTPDLRNHGLSPHSDVWDYEVMADDLKEFIDHHKLDNPIIMGHSMGGKVLMFFEAKYNGVTDKLIIADISPRAYEPHHHEVLAALNSVDFSVVKTRKEAESQLGEYIKDFGTKQFLLKNIYWRDTENNIMDWRFNLKVITASYNNIGVMAPEFKSDVPCLIIRGECSNYVT
ncbi:MAG: putative hydrolase, partial [Bacteroidetes bacterium]|nr:putative hydrolase [Bacteroidota bacterium]